jgi:hypothetical protein
VALQWLLGFRDLGWEPILIDRLEEGNSTDDVEQLAEVMSHFGLRWTVLVPGAEPLGMGIRELDRQVGSCELLLNVMGYLHPEMADRFPLRVFLDIDPGFGQMWKALGLADIFAGHEGYVTVGNNVGRDGCGVPDVGLEWLPTLPPVALEHWPAVAGGRDVTSIATWRGPFSPVDYAGRRYGLRVHEFRRFADLPQRSSETFRLALDIDAGDEADRDRLMQAGWKLINPRTVAGDPFAYREFIQSSSIELCIAKEMYVATRSGWFSDRSACYLASGKPVLAQDTGFGDALPTGQGLLTFTALEEAISNVEKLRRDRRHHGHAARRLAEEYLAADRVIRRLLNRIGVD